MKKLSETSQIIVDAAVKYQRQNGDIVVNEVKEKMADDNISSDIIDKVSDVITNGFRYTRVGAGTYRHKESGVAHKDSKRNMSVRNVSNLSPKEQTQINDMEKFRDATNTLYNISLQIDHVIPVDEGGLYEYNNIQLLCKSQNVRKGTQAHHTRMILETQYNHVKSCVGTSLYLNNGNYDMFEFLFDELIRKHYEEEI